MAILLIVYVYLFVSFSRPKIRCDVCEFINYSSHQKINLLSPKKTEIIYQYDIGIGEDFWIFDYKSKKDIKNLIKINKLNKVDDNNINKVNNLLEKYYSDLQESRRKKFDENTTIQELINTNNSYYLYIEVGDNQEGYYIIILNVNDKKLYCFYVNRYSM